MVEEARRMPRVNTRAGRRCAPAQACHLLATALTDHKEHRLLMADNHDPRCRQCRREGVKLYLKGDKCYTKCTLDKTSRDGKTKWRDKPPGMHAAPTFQK